MNGRMIIVAHLTSVMAACNALASTVYVDRSAPAGGDGSSWENAFHRLQDGLAEAASDPAVDEVWIAQGAYGPGLSTSATFNLPNGVRVYGGFPSGGGTLNQRDAEANPTILTGRYGPTATPSYVEHVVTCNVNAWADLIGVTIRHGNTPTFGGGVLVSSGRFGLYDSTVESCRAFAGGGIAVLVGTEATIKGVTFSENFAALGGGLYAGFGIGIDATVYVSHSIFLDNSSSVGGAVFSEADLMMESCLIARNVADGDGGGIYLSSSIIDRFTLINLTIADNESKFGQGGGIYVDSYDAGCTIANSIIYFNEASSDPEVAVGSGAVGLPDGYSNWLRPYHADPLFVDRAAGNYRLETSPLSPCINAGDIGWLGWLAKLMGDLDGENRIQESIVDVGAYEQASPLPAPLIGDANGDGVVDFRDITCILTNWGNDSDD